MTCIKEVSLVNVNGALRLSFSPLSAYDPVSYKVPEGSTLELPAANGGSLSITVCADTITVNRTKAVTNCFHDCFKNPAYSVFTTHRAFGGDSDLLVVEDSGFYEIFADCGTILFTVNTY